MSSVPIWIWYLVGAVLAVILLKLVLGLIFAAITYPKRKREYGKMKSEFDEHKARVSERLNADPSALRYGRRISRP